MNSEQHITNLLIAINQTQWCLCRFCERGPILIETFISIALLFPFHRFLSLFISISLCWIDIIYLHLYLPLSVYVSVSLSLYASLSPSSSPSIFFSIHLDQRIKSKVCWERKCGKRACNAIVNCSNVENISNNDNDIIFRLSLETKSFELCRC